jgi:hypothetical protein
MKKILLLTLFVLTSVISFSQFKVTKDTTGVDTTRGKGLFYKPKKKTSPFSADFGVASTNLWRGTDVGKQTGIMLIAEYEPAKWVTMGMQTYVVANQYRPGYGNQMITSVKGNIYNTSIGIQDVYFQNQELVSDTDFFNINKETTNHFVEATFNYKGDASSKMDLFASRVIYQNTNNVNGAFFIQATYHPNFNTELFAGYLTKESMVNFQEKGGFTNIGLTIKRNLELSTKTMIKAKLTVSVNPNYKTIVQTNPAVSGRPVNANLVLLF